MLLNLTTWSDNMPTCPICSSVRRIITLRYYSKYDSYDCGCGYSITTLGLKEVEKKLPITT